MISNIKKFHENLKITTERHSHLFFPLIFASGFILDLLTLNRIDETLDLLILLTHAVLVMVWILFWHASKSAKKCWKKWPRFRKFGRTFAPGAMQFSFGALFSGFVIFYTKSASVLISWPFLIILYFLFVGNESFRKFYKGLFFQMGVFYFSVLTLLIFLVPLFVKQIGPIIFFLSGVLSLVFIGGFFWLIIRVFKSISKQDHQYLWLSTLLIWMTLNVLYYEDIVPAIPLSLKSDGLYYHIERTNSGYAALEESQGFFKKLLPPNTIHKPEGEWVYYFSAIFAPNHFSEQVVHHWQRYDEKYNYWKNIFEKPLTIVGGRDGGYRGYTYLVNPHYGKWRVVVRTPKGQVLGQKNFRVLKPETPPKTEHKKL